jgi:ABC-2 type transport system ATP-binding protein
MPSVSSAAPTPRGRADDSLPLAGRQTRPAGYPHGVSAPAVEVTDLVMRYRDKIAVDQLSLAIEPGSIVALLGPNGAGKTTTIETCEGFRRPQSGSVRVLGLDPIRDARALRPRVGVMLQSGGAWSGVRATELLRHVASLYAHPLDIDLLVDRLGLHGCGRTPYRRLSGGEQQRLGLATAIVGRPELVFLDEPTTGLDPQARRASWELIGNLNDDGVTVVFTTHHMEEAERLATSVHIVDRGHVIVSGSPAQLMATGSGDVIRFRARPGLDTEALAAVLPPGATAVRGADSTYEVRTTVTPDTVAAVAAWCAKHDVLIHDLSFGQRTLEDVFLELTGRELRS